MENSLINKALSPIRNGNMTCNGFREDISPSDTDQPQEISNTLVFYVNGIKVNKKLIFDNKKKLLQFNEIYIKRLNIVHLDLGFR